MSLHNSSPRTPKHMKISWNKGSESKSPGPGYSSTPSSKANGGTPYRIRHTPRRRVLDDRSPPKKSARLSFSPGPGCSNVVPSPSKERSGKALESDKNYIGECSDGSAEGHSPLPNAAESGTVSVNLEFPHGGWDEDSSDERSSCGLEIVESEAELLSSPIKKGPKQAETELHVEDNAILSGMGEEIERQLEAKAERNRLTVPNVKNILRSVITNPHVLAMVRRSMKNGNVAVSGDLDDIVYEPIITRAKAKQLLERVPEITWASSSQKVSPTSRCHVLMNEDLDDSDDDEEYKPFEDEPSDNDYSERDGSERGSERDISMEQSPAYFDPDNESCPPTPSPKPNISHSYTQTNWSEDGIFKVPKLPLEHQSDQQEEENIALRTRSKLPLNDTPLEEIEQAFVPPDITPDLYDTTCDNADWQEFLKEFMQPMRSEAHNNDDEEEDPEYNVLADEEIIDREELRRDRAVKVSKRELNELMRELMEFTENLSSEDEDKCLNRNLYSEAANASPGQFQDDFDFLEAFIASGSFTPIQTSKLTPQSTPTCNSGLNTPVPPISPPSLKTPDTGKQINSSFLGKDNKNSYSFCNGEEVFVNQDSKEENHINSVGKENSNFIKSVDSSEESQGPSNFECIGEKQDEKTTSGCRRGKTGAIKRLRTGKKTADLDLIDESNSSPTSLPNLKSGNGVSTALASSRTPLKLLIKDLPLVSFREGTLHIEQALPQLSPSKSLSDESLSDECLQKALEETCSLTPLQRLLLDQQMRQHVQLLTQHFLQCYEHPAFGDYAAGCKEMLFTLKYLGAARARSSFGPANLSHALEVVSTWENVMLSDEGDQIRSFWQMNIDQNNIFRKRRHKFVGSFPPKLMETVADSAAFVYPTLLPKRSFQLGKPAGINHPSEIMLLTLGYEQFYPYVMEMYPKKKGSWHRKTVSLIAEHLLTPKSEITIYDFLRKSENNAIERYRQTNYVPKTTHVVIPFDELQMKPVKMQPHNVLSKLWRDYVYPACD